MSEDCGRKSLPSSSYNDIPLLEAVNGSPHHQTGIHHLSDAFSSLWSILLRIDREVGTSLGHSLQSELHLSAILTVKAAGSRVNLLPAPCHAHLNVNINPCLAVLSF